MGNGIPESFNRLTRHAAIAAGLNEGHRSHDGKCEFTVFEELVDREEGRLGIERIENRFDQENIDSAIH